MTEITEEVNGAEENCRDSETDDRPFAATRQNRMTEVELGIASTAVHGIGLSIGLY